ncbi:MAG: hypothetical protein JNG85_01980 [Spirochaetaceae bacterium]|nr:hypothetical protein [Spirochaetaceae bacterium]
MELDSANRSKLDAVLARVKEPLSELTLQELGLVSKFTYSAKEKTIVAALNVDAARFECPACSAMYGEVIQGIERNLREELLKEFPGFTILFE